MRLPRIALAAVVVSGLLVAGLAAPASAFASWFQQPTVDLGPTDTSVFNAVSCTAPSTCMAVGLLTASTEQLLSETRGPSGWTSQPIPQPAPGSQLLAVWCVKASDCTAVGYAPAGTGSVPLAERWNGSSWKIESTPAPGGATFSELTGVACTSPVRCVAVGNARTSTKESPLAELWNGSTWKVLTTPKPGGQPVSSLSGISCPSATRCFAVGSSRKNVTQKTLAEVLNGSKWTIVKTPTPVQNGRLDSVSCRSVTWCMAVGSGFAERWNGKTWSALKVGKPAGSAADLSSVSCVKAGSCYAVGAIAPGGVVTAVAESWNGSKWSVQPVPIFTSSDDSVLAGVSCTTATNCTASGFYHDPVNGDRALAEDFSIRWQRVSPPSFINTQSAALSAVSCVSATACVAVGSVETGGVSESISESWDGNGWASFFGAEPKRVELAGVSCVTATACTAVGDIPSAGNARPAAERWNGTSWKIQKTPAPAGSKLNVLFGVSCPGKTTCFAVGVRTNSTDKQRTLAERWNGKIWQVTPTPNPAGKSEIRLTSVSCSSVNSCVAVGSFLGGVIAQTWNGQAWKATAPVPNPAGASRSQFRSVSCSSADDCIAVGGTVRSSGEVPLAEHWNGKKWSPQHPAETPPGLPTTLFTSVSCSSSRACTAVGFGVGTVSTDPIAQSWTGKRWIARLVNSSSGLGGMIAPLDQVSCNSANACIAVGSFVDSSHITQMLAEQYS